MSDPFIAEIKIFAGNFAPRNFAFCSGQLLPIAQHTALFSLIGTTFGGDGRTTTALPNLQGRAPMHPGRGPGLTSRRLGERLGVNTVSLSDAQMPSHSHPMTAATNAVSAAPGAALRPGAAAMYNTAGAAAPMASAAIGPFVGGGDGGGQPHDNQQPYLGLNFIIALQGLFPSRS